MADKGKKLREVYSLGPVNEEYATTTGVPVELPAVPPAAPPHGGFFRLDTSPGASPVFDPLPPEPPVPRRGVQPTIPEDQNLRRWNWSPRPEDVYSKPGPVPPPRARPREPQVTVTMGEPRITGRTEFSRPGLFRLEGPPPAVPPGGQVKRAGPNLDELGRQQFAWYKAQGLSDQDAFNRARTDVLALRDRLSKSEED